MHGISPFIAKLMGLLIDIDRMVGREMETGLAALKAQAESKQAPDTTTQEGNIMHKQIYVNLPVKDMARSRAFFASLGFDFNPQFSNDQGACMVIGENIFAMLLAEPFFQSFTSKPIADAHADAPRC